MPSHHPPDSSPQRAHLLFVTRRASGPSAHLESVKTDFTTETASRVDESGSEIGHRKVGRSEGGPTSSVPDRRRSRAARREPLWSRLFPGVTPRRGGGGGWCRARPCARGSRPA